MSDKYKEAISDYSVVIKSGSEDDHIYSGRAFCYYKIKQNNLALNDYRVACELSKDEKSFTCDMVKSLEKGISRGDKWVYYASSGSTEYYYDKNSIKHLTKGDIRVWERMEENADSYIKYLTKEGLPTQGYETYSFTLNLDEYDCKNMKTGILTTIDYNEKGEVLYSTTVQTVKMREIIPDTIGESLYKLVCQEKKKSKKQN
jgi:tetratricopeptide (TPR) repeat protein